MLLLEFDRGLFKLSAGSPAFVVLLKLPPRNGKRGKYSGLFPKTFKLFKRLHISADHAPDFIKKLGPVFVFL